MNKIDAIVSGLLLCCCMVATASGQEPMKPWEKYGLSRTEWKMVVDNKVSEDRLKVILSSGISVGEYCQKPWKKLGIKENEWMDKRRAGMSSYDIELDIKTDRTGYKQDNKKMMKVDTASETAKQTPGLFTSFILPGYQQQKLGRKTRGTIMSGLAIGLIAGSFVMSVSEGRFEPIPLLIVVPDMFWSLFDFKFGEKKKEPE